MAGYTDVVGGTAKGFSKDNRPHSPLIFGPSASKAAALCGQPGPSRRAARLPAPPLARAHCPPVRPWAAERARSGLPGRVRPSGRQQLVSPQGAAPPFPGTKAAARAGAPGGGPRGGAARVLGSRTSEMGHPQRAPPNFPPPTFPSPTGWRCRGWVCRASAERTDLARGPRPSEGVFLGWTRDLRGTEGPARSGSAREAEPGEGAQSRRVGNLLQSSDS